MKNNSTLKNNNLIMNKKKAIFLDRDGVINEDYGYVYRIKDFKFKNGIFEFLKNIQTLNYEIFIVTNQSGIARKLYSLQDFKNLMEWMINIFKKNNIFIKDYRFCPHYPNITGVCDCRKPKPGMILDLANRYNIDLKKSIMIGDKLSDIQAGENAGIKKNFLFKNNFDDILKGLK